MQKKDKFLRLHSNTVFHQEVQPINPETLAKKEEIFRKNLERRVEAKLLKKSSSWKEIFKSLLR